MKIHEPPMTFKNPEAAVEWAKGLKKNQDPYGKAVYRYASEWATRMEQEINNGKKIAEIAHQTSHESDDEGITGFMYGTAVSMLSAWWLHGEALRLWHNIKTQIGKEGDAANESGGVLNPALLNIDVK